MAQGRATRRPAYAAPALEKGLDILEMLCRAEAAPSRKEIAQALGRSTGEIYRMLAVLIGRGYVAAVDERHHLTTKLFELAQANPPTRRLLAEALPVMRGVSDALDQSCHLTVYSGGRQVVLAKVDAPGGMGFSVRVGAELDVLVSASGRVLLAFQDAPTRLMWIEESRRRRPGQAEPRIATILQRVRARGFASIASVQVRGLHAVSFPVLDAGGHAIAALTVPYAERIDRARRKPIAAIERHLGAAARGLSLRLGGFPPSPRAR